MKAIGIDIGTTTISASVIEGETKKVERTYTLENNSFINTEATWSKIQDPQIITAKTLKLLDSILETDQDIGVIGLTGQMHGIVYTDKKGKHVSPLYTWQDECGNVKCFGKKSVCEILEEKYGVEAYAGYGLITHLFHSMTNQVPAGAENICTIMDYMAMILTGNQRPKIHSSNAAGMGLYDVKKKKFDIGLLNKMDLAQDILPEVSDDFDVIGTYRQIPVCIAIGDNQASFIGSVNEAEDTILVNIGTGGQISMLSDTYYSIKGIEVRPLAVDKYLLVGSSLCGGRAYAVLERFFRTYSEAIGIKAIDHFKVMSQLLEARDNSVQRLKVDTRFSGTRENPAKRGTIENIGMQNFTPAELVYGVLYGMAEELHEMYMDIEKTTGKKVQKIIASGNGLRKNPGLQKIVGECFGMQLKMSSQEEEAACGAAMAGLIAINKITTLHIRN